VAEPPPEVAPQSSTHKNLGIAGLVIGGAGLVTWGIAGGIALGKKSTLDGPDGCTSSSCPASAASDRSSFEAARTASTAGFVIGLVGVGAGVVLLATAPRAQPQATRGLSIAPWIGAASGGIAGRF
jgi:hypothetical protein